MRRKLLTVISALLVAVLGTSLLSGCLITTNVERDMSQVVAAVRIEGYKNRDEITKRELINAFLNTGYQYVQYGYSYADTFNLMLDMLVNRRVIIQTATLEFEKLPWTEESPYGVVDATKEGVARFLTADEIARTEYEVKKSINEIIDDYEEDLVPEKDEEEEEEETDEDEETTLRPVPTVYDEEEDEEIPEGYHILANEPSEVEGSTERTRRRAFNKFIKALHDNGLISDPKVEPEDVMELDYVKDEIVNQQETLLIEKYQDKIAAETEARLTSEILSKRWNDMVAIQKQSYLTESTYSSALGSASDESFVLYNPYEGYGYVLNLLLTPNAKGSRLLSALTAAYQKTTISEAEYNARREEIVKTYTTEISDRRGTWITLGDEELFTATETEGTEGEYKVTFGEKLLASSKLAEFNGTVTKKKNGDYKVSFDKEGEKITFEELMQRLAGDLGVADAGEYAALNKVFRSNADLVASGEATDIFRDYMFAYSEDDSESALNTYKGYVTTPVLNDKKNGQYVKEFEAGARAVVEAGVGAYTIVVTDYGYHVIYCAEKIEPGEVTEPDWGSLDWEAEKEARSLAYLFREAILADMQSAAYSDLQAETLDKYTAEGTGYVVRYEKRYKNLLNLG